MLEALTKDELDMYLARLDRCLQGLSIGVPIRSGHNDHAAPATVGEKQRQVRIAVRALQLEVCSTSQDSHLAFAAPRSEGANCEWGDGSELRSILVELATRELGEDIEAECVRHLDRLVALGAALLWLLSENSPVPVVLLKPVWRSLLDRGGYAIVDCRGQTQDSCAMSLRKERRVP
jgi:hypothetical protein